MILISACLAGVNCRYDGKNNYCPQIKKIIETEATILVCPEQLGGLPTPRVPAEISGKKVVDLQNKDVTIQFMKGAEETLKIARLYNCDLAILKQRSPSCGYGKIYDGTHSGKIVEGNGITARLLVADDIEILSEEDIKKPEFSLRL